MKRLVYVCVCVVHACVYASKTGTRSATIPKKLEAQPFRKSWRRAHHTKRACSRPGRTGIVDLRPHESVACREVGNRRFANQVRHKSRIDRFEVRVPEEGGGGGSGAGKAPHAQPYHKNFKTVCGTNVLQKEKRKDTMGSATHGLKQTQLAAQRYGYNRPTLVACRCFQAGKRLNYI